MQSGVNRRQDGRQLLNQIALVRRRANYDYFSDIFADREFPVGYCFSQFPIFF